MSNRISDTRGEKALAIFLDTYFYPALLKETKRFSDIKRIYNVAEQKLGIDVLIYDQDAKSLTVDEKAQLHYINNPKDTFAFEVSFLQEDTGDVVDGWFVSRSNLTKCYMLVWLDKARTDKLNRIVAEDFEEVTIYFIVKEKIKSYLLELGLSTEALKEKASDMRQNNVKLIQISKDAFLYHSEKYKESPINVVINRDVLKTKAYGIYHVTKEGLSKI